MENKNQYICLMKRLFILILLLNNSLIANDLNQIRNILKHVETNYDVNAIGDSGDSIGILQIQGKTIIDVNEKFGTDYTHEDALIEKCAEEIFNLYIKMWKPHVERKEGREVTEEDIVRIWNGGPNGYKRYSTLIYLKKYYKYKRKLVMNRKICIVNNKKGVIMNVNTHTYDIFLTKTKRMMFGVNKTFVKTIATVKTKKEMRAEGQHLLQL
jgi:hypothetical protein